MCAIVNALLQVQMFVVVPNSFCTDYRKQYILKLAAINDKQPNQGVKKIEFGTRTTINVKSKRIKSSQARLALSSRRARVLK